LKVTLLYNEDAGDGASLDHIRATLARHGHHLVRVLDKTADAEGMLARPTELVVAAGGDGTVTRAARRLHGRGVPIAILPLGTANNIARCLGNDLSMDELMARWNVAAPRPLDLGVARGWWGERCFLEAAGVGLIPAGIAAAKAHAAQDENPSTVKVPDAARKYRQVLSRLRARRLTISLDGTRVTGEFLLVEVLNICSVGPNLLLSLAADPSDGLLSVVMATEDQRDELAEYLEQRTEGEPRALALPVRHARRVEIAEVDQIHVDDRYLVARAPEPVSMEILPGALEFVI